MQIYDIVRKLNLSQKYDENAYNGETPVSHVFISVTEALQFTIYNNRLFSDRNNSHFVLLLYLAVIKFFLNI